MWPHQSMLVIQGPFVTGRINWDGEYVLGADHYQIAQLLSHVARRLGIPVRWYNSGHVPTLAVARFDLGLIAIDAGAANTLAVLHGEVALIFPILHELGHFRNPTLVGRHGERAADGFATTALLALGYSPTQILAGAAVTLADTADDGVHDAGWRRLEMIRSILAIAQMRNRRN